MWQMIIEYIRDWRYCPKVFRIKSVPCTQVLLEHKGKFYTLAVSPRMVYSGRTIDLLSVRLAFESKYILDLDNRLELKNRLFQVGRVSQRWRDTMVSMSTSTTISDLDPGYARVHRMLRGEEP